VTVTYYCITLHLLLSIALPCAVMPTVLLRLQPTVTNRCLLELTDGNSKSLFPVG